MRVDMPGICMCCNNNLTVRKGFFTQFFGYLMSSFGRNIIFGRKRVNEMIILSAVCGLRLVPYFLGFLKLLRIIVVIVEIQR